MEENWDDEFSAPSSTITKPVDDNNNIEEPKRFSFAETDKRPLGRGRPSENKSTFDFKNRSNDNDQEQQRSSFSFKRNENEENGENKGFNSFNRRNNEDSGNGEKKGFGGFNRRNNDDSESGEKRGFNGGFRRNNDSEGGERRPFNRRNDQSESGERKPFRKFDRNDENGEKKEFGGFNRRNNDDSEGGERKGFNGGFRRDNNSEGQRGFNRRNNDDSENGEKRGFGGFNRRNNENEGEERKGFGNKSFGDRDEKGRFGRDKSNGDGERRPFSRRNGEDGDKENGFSGRKSFNKDDQKKDGEEGPKRERYIPDDVEETEESLFSTVAVGVNFKKQIEIKTTISGNDNEKIIPLNNFEEAKFSELLMSNIKKTQYEIPTAVQKYGIPIILSRRDLMACAQTGSGKTAAFVLPIMKNILEDGIQSSALSGIQEPQALILSPTRELALQILHECKKFSHDSMIKTGILYGGVDTGFQIRKLEHGCNILVATPGRLLDVLEKKKISLEKVKYFVLDEADRMLDLGFEKAVRDILEKGQVNKKGDRCTFMFSATFPNEIQKLAQDFLHDYLFLAVGEVGGANKDVQQTIYKVGKFDKRNKCTELLDDIGNEKTMIFVEAKKSADVLAFFLIQKGYPTTTIHGDRFQSQREIALSDFKSGKSSIIVCTAVAARGLDIEKVNHVINFDLPSTIDEYVHRIGRTGRCGNLGKAISFFDPESENDQKLARPLVRILTQAEQTVPEWLNSFAEDSVGSAFMSKSNTSDLRGKFKSLTIESKSTPADSSSAQAEESWD